MSVIFICGADRVGKTTQIRNIQKFFEKQNRDVLVIHYSSIHVQNVGPFKSGAECVASRSRYEDMMHLADLYVNNRNLLVFDRAHLGEYVYSPMYRKYSGDYVFDLEKDHPLMIDNAKLFLFTDAAENLCRREDGNSFSSDVENKKKELELFNEAFEKSNIKNKMIISIEDKDENAVWDIIKKELENV